MQSVSPSLISDFAASFFAKAAPGVSMETQTSGPLPAYTTQLGGFGQVA